jgi:hypothetical protein
MLIPQISSLNIGGTIKLGISYSLSFIGKGTQQIFQIEGLL